MYHSTQQQQQRKQQRESFTQRAAIIPSFAALERISVKRQGTNLDSHHIIY